MCALIKKAIVLWAPTTLSMLTKLFLLLWCISNLCTLNIAAGFWVGTFVKNIIVCAHTIQIAVMTRIPFKHSMWFDDFKFSIENNFIPFVYTENTKSGWYFFPTTEKKIILNRWVDFGEMHIIFEKIQSDDGLSVTNSNHYYLYYLRICGQPCDARNEKLSINRINVWIIELKCFELVPPNSHQIVDCKHIRSLMVQYISYPVFIAIIANIIPNKPLKMCEK